MTKRLVLWQMIAPVNTHTHMHMQTHVHTCVHTHMCTQKSFYSSNYSALPHNFSGKCPFGLSMNRFTRKNSKVLNY